MQTVSITVKGIVQGVFYRQQTKETALRSGITGEVKNLPNGDVYILATGTEKQLEEFIQWCNKGPRRAVVTEVIVEKIPVCDFPTFKITG